MGVSAFTGGGSVVDSTHLPVSSDALPTSGRGGPDAAWPAHSTMVLAQPARSQL